MRPGNTARITIATAICLIVAMDSPPGAPSIPVDRPAPPSLEEVQVLEELLDWVRAGRPGSHPRRRQAFGLGDIVAAIREHPRSFELFRSFHEPSDQLRILKTLPFAAEIESAATRYQVDGLLIAAMIQAESGFDPEAVSPVGARGLMQIIPETADLYGASDWTEPSTNIRLGTRYLASLFRQFDGDIEVALAAYNAGPGNVMKFGGVPPFSETRHYVRRVLTSYFELHQRTWEQSGATDYLL